METARILLSFYHSAGSHAFHDSKESNPHVFLADRRDSVRSDFWPAIDYHCFRDLQRLWLHCDNVRPRCDIRRGFSLNTSVHQGPWSTWPSAFQRLQMPREASTLSISWATIISIPVNFTPAAALMMPLLKRLSATLKKPIQSYACAFSVASFSTNCLVIPTMTPVMLASMAGITGNRLGWMIVFGLLISFAISAVAALGGALILVKKYGNIQRAADVATEQETAATGSQAPIAITLLMVLLPIL